MIKIRMTKNKPRFCCECERSDCDYCGYGSTQGGGDVRMNDLYDLIKNPPPAPINETTHVYYIV